MPILILWIIWKIAEPQTTKMNRANNQGPTDAFSSGAFLEVLATLPRWVMFLLCFSLAIRIRCLATIFAAPPPAQATPQIRSLPPRAAATLRSRCPCSRRNEEVLRRGTSSGHWAWARALSASGAWAADWGTPGWPAQRGGRAGGQQADGIGSPWRRRERGLKEEGKATRGPLSPSARTTSGSAANVSTGRTPPLGSAGSACRRTGWEKAKAGLGALAQP